MLVSDISVLGSLYLDLKMERGRKSGLGWDGGNGISIVFLETGSNTFPYLYWKDSTLFRILMLFRRSFYIVVCNIVSVGGGYDAAHLTFQQPSRKQYMLRRRLPTYSSYQ